VSVGGVTFLLEPLDLFLGQTQTFPPAPLRRREIGTEVEQFVLDPLQQPGRALERCRPADQRIQLVDLAGGFNAGMDLRHAASVPEAGLPFVAAASVDARQPDGFVAQRARQVLAEATELLRTIGSQGLLSAIGEGTFGVTRRPADGGRGLDGVVQRADGYVATMVAGEVTYEHDTDTAIASARDGATTILLRAVEAETLKRVADSWERLPQKTTYFYPKVPAGLVLRPLGD